MEMTGRGIAPFELTSLLPYYSLTRIVGAVEMTQLVLIPGLMCDAGLWQAMLPELALMGSLTFGDLSQEETIEQMATRVLNACPPAFVLVGFSMGGFVAREIARRAPHRVQGLVLIATSSAGDSPLQSELKEAVAASLSDASGEFRGLGRRAIKLSLSERHENDADKVRQILDMRLRLGRETYIRQLLMPRNDDSMLNLPPCPTLVIAAADDRMRTLAESQALCDAIPQATLCVIDDSGHMLPLEQPQRLARVLAEWLDTYLSRV